MEDHPITCKMEHFVQANHDTFRALLRRTTEAVGFLAVEEQTVPYLLTIGSDAALDVDARLLEVALF